MGKNDLNELSFRSHIKNEKGGLALPADVNTALNKLVQAGYQGFVVGGSLRDLLLGKSPKDWDLTTSASPFALVEIFGDAVCNLAGLKFGTVGISFNKKEVIEITSFRSESDYVDNRHPGKIEFALTVEEDLQRRDFTINALAYNHEDGLIDLYDGQKDLQNRILRTVGNPKLRFREDALRILRGIRFAAVLNLSIEPETFTAMSEFIDNLESIAEERIIAEIDKLLMDITLPLASELDFFLGKIVDKLGLKTANSAIRINNAPLNWKLICALPKKSDLLWAVWLTELGVDGDSSIVRALKLGKKKQSHISWFIENYQSLNIIDEVTLKLAIVDAGMENIFNLLNYRLALGESGVHCENYDLRKKIQSEKDSTLYYLQLLEKWTSGDLPIDQRPCLSLSDLAVNGDDLLSCGYKGREIGNHLQILMKSVISGDVANEKEKMLDFLQNNI